MFGSNDPRYRTASLRSMLLACATSGGKTIFMMLMSYAGYMANAGYGVLVMVTGIIMTVIPDDRLRSYCTNGNSDV